MENVCEYVCCHLCPIPLSYMRRIDWSFHPRGQNLWEYIPTLDFCAHPFDLSHHNITRIYQSFHEIRVRIPFVSLVDSVFVDSVTHFFLYLFATNVAKTRNIYNKFMTDSHFFLYKLYILLWFISYLRFIYFRSFRTIKVWDQIK